MRAYHLWEQAGRPEGRDAEFWEQARGMEGDQTAHGGGEGVAKQPGGTQASVPRR